MMNYYGFQAGLPQYILPWGVFVNKELAEDGHRMKGGDDEEEMIALGSVLQILSKDILTTVMPKDDWKNAITTFATDVEKETDYASIRKQYRDFM